MKKITKEQMLKAIQNSNGLITKIQRRIEAETQEKWSWTTVQKYVDKWEETRQAVADERNIIGDVAEQKVYEAVIGGDLQTAKWYLTLKHKDRGYDPGATFRVQTENPLNVNFGGMTQEDLLKADNVELGGVDGE